MTDLGHPSKRHRGGEQPQRKKRSCGQPHATSNSTSTKASDPIIPQDYNIASQPFNQPSAWEEYGTLAMDWHEDGGDKLGSVNSHTTSYPNAHSPSAEVETTMGGYVMVPNQSSGAYSSGSGSHQNSEETEEQGQQEFYSPPCTPVADLIVDTQCTLNDSLGLPAHEQQWMLSGLGIPGPASQWNVYQQQAVIAGGDIYHEFSENYSLHRMDPPGITESSSPAAKQQDSYSEPWNQTALRVPRYPPSFPAFGLSPESDIQEAPRQSRSYNKKSSCRPSKLSSCLERKEKTVSPGWEHIVVKNGGLRIVSEHHNEEGRHCSGGRTGKLDKDAADKAARVRKLRACWPCWLSKAPCSEGDICKRCIKTCTKKSPLADQLCCRSGFMDYEPAFFPDYLHSHLRQREIEALINENSTGFTNDGLMVKVSTGSAFAPIGLYTYFYKPKHGFESELLKQYHLTTETEEQRSSFLCRYSAPVGLIFLSKSDVKKILREHIEQMVANPCYPGQTTMGDATRVPFLILDEVRQYCRKTDNSLVRSALMLHAMHYFMGSLVTFTADSAAEVYARSPNYKVVPPEPYLSSRLLNRQLKFVMHRLHKEITREVLQELEKSMRSRTKDAWGPSFAAILVLSLCIEELQTAADTFVVCDNIKEGDQSGYRREQSRKACEEVEDYPYERCTRLFHDIFKTRKEGNSGLREGGFNPLKMVEGGLETGLDEPTDVLVKSIYGWVGESRGALQELSQRPALLAYVEEPKDIKINNTGRLVAKFLMSFFARDL